MARIVPLFFAVLCGMIPSLSCWALQSDLQALLTAKSLRCYLGPGALADWTSDGPARPPVKLETFGASSVDSMIIFDSIDTKANRARLIGNAGADDVAVHQTPLGLVFVDRTMSGGEIFVTVYGVKVQMEYALVYSFHIEIGGVPRPSQYYGTCKILIS